MTRNIQTLFERTAVSSPGQLGGLPDLLVRDLSIWDRWADIPSLPRRELIVTVMLDQMRRTVDLLEQRGVACPELLWWLASFDSNCVNGVSAHLERAAAQLKDMSLTVNRSAYELITRPIKLRKADGRVAIQTALPEGEPSIASTYERMYASALTDPLLNAPALTKYEGNDRGRHVVTYVDASGAGETVLTNATATAVQLYAVRRGGNIHTLRLHEHELYLVEGGSTPSLPLQVVRISPKMGQASIVGTTNRDIAFSGLSSMTLDVSATGVHVPTSAGIWSLSLTNGPPRLLGLDQGFPVEFVTDVVELDGWLYAGLRGDEGYLIRVRPDGTSFEVLACSGRKEQKSELDDCEPYSVGHMVVDKDRRRLYFSVLSTTEESRRGNTYVYSLESGDMNRLVGQKNDPNSIFGLFRWPRHLPDGRWLVCVNPYGLSKYGWSTESTARTNDSEYAIWDPSLYGGVPVHRIERLVWPLMGDAQGPDHTHLDIPSFPIITPCGSTNSLYPSEGSRFAVLNETHIVAANPDVWAVIPRDDTLESPASLPLLDGATPIWVDVHEGDILAATPKGIWRVKLGGR
jgi:hypothetical protein